MLKLLFLDTNFELLAHADVAYPTRRGNVLTFVARCPVVKSGSVFLILVFVDGLWGHTILPLPSDSLENLEVGQILTYSSGVDVSLTKKVNEHLKVLSVEHYRVSNDKSTIVSTDVEWFPLETAPLGAKVWALTVGRVGLSTTLTKATLKDYLGWYPIPKEPPWVKGKGLGYPVQTAELEYSADYTSDSQYERFLDETRQDVCKGFSVPKQVLNNEPAPINGPSS